LGSREKFAICAVVLVLVVVFYEEFYQQPANKGSGNGGAGRPGVQRMGCPSACDNGKRIDNSVCPQLSGEGVAAILQTLDSNSVVWEWGKGSSAVYFAQCVKEWNIVISDPEHCRDIKDVASPNTKVMWRMQT